MRLPDFAVTLFTKIFSWPDASMDECLKCEVIRKNHVGAGHPFKED